MSTFEEELESERYTHSRETLAEVLRRVRKERFDTPAHEMRKQQYLVEKLRKQGVKYGRS